MASQDNDEAGDPQRIKYCPLATGEAKDSRSIRSHPHDGRLHYKTTISGPTAPSHTSLWQYQPIANAAAIVTNQDRPNHWEIPVWGTRRVDETHADNATWAYIMYRQHNARNTYVLAHIMNPLNASLSISEVQYRCSIPMYFVQFV
ncbi:hypothetical protein M413DRAFT_447216 [Hebeloma cylindrosporum]|uniref:Uncharacterized protein n=1 Tax=Hebeloma cylindrosporum TaxID=76867 RepID=A0A0C3C4T7_HEBCY|nr:hypothetical protein M413DRAFT_447216 [Hebeloma cylindrosporum h7]